MRRHLGYLKDFFAQSEESTCKHFSIDEIMERYNGIHVLKCLQRQARTLFLPAFCLSRADEYFVKFQSCTYAGSKIAGKTLGSSGGKKVMFISWYQFDFVFMWTTVSLLLYF